jgi:hypothetical protein
MSGIIKKATTTTTNKESLKTKRTLIFIALTAVCGGYILLLAVLAPQQLAEATTAATNLVCNGCVGSSDIADETIQSRDISNTAGVASVDIRDGQVGSVDIRDRTITRNDIALQSLPVAVQTVQSEPTTVPPNEFATASVNCPQGSALTGGGFFISRTDMRIGESAPSGNGWVAQAFNGNAVDEGEVVAYAACVFSVPAS